MVRFVAERELGPSPFLFQPLKSTSSQNPMQESGSWCKSVFPLPLGFGEIQNFLPVQFRPWETRAAWGLPPSAGSGGLGDRLVGKTFENNSAAPLVEARSLLMKPQSLSQGWGNLKAGSLACVAPAGSEPGPAQAVRNGAGSLLPVPRTRLCRAFFSLGVGGRGRPGFC